jgi:phosphatidylserine/phosphatidylglycerophosphate/cardiolipin synthase-like enzyme
MSAEFSPRWFLDGTEYPRKAATFGLLINGQEAFRAVHEAIAAAKKSVCIICWGFQPSMYFIRDGKSPCIGDLLEANAREGKKIRVLSWSMEIPTPLHRTVGVTGFAGEPNTPGRRDLAISDKLAGMTDQQFEYNKHWFGLYDAQTDHNVKRSFRSLYRGLVNDTSMQNLVFRSRGFTPPDRAIIATHSYLDKGISNTTRSVLASSTSHHQKMVLIDHESAEDAVGFVMGHNMLDWYWDTSAHSMKGRPYLPNLGPNAPLPREDFSSRVTGPVLNDLYDNFQGAWNRALLEEPGPYAQALRTSKSPVARMLRCQRKWCVLRFRRACDTFSRCTCKRSAMPRSRSTLRTSISDGLPLRSTSNSTPRRWRSGGSRQKTMAVFSSS